MQTKTIIISLHLLFLLYLSLWLFQLFRWNVIDSRVQIYGKFKNSLVLWVKDAGGSAILALSFNNKRKHD